MWVYINQTIWVNAPQSRRNIWNLVIFIDCDKLSLFFGFSPPVLCAGGVFGAAAQWPFLQDSRGVSGVGGEGVAVLRPQIRPAEQPEPQQSGQWIHPHLPAVPGLRSPGELYRPVFSTWLLSDSTSVTISVISAHSLKANRQGGEKGERFCCHHLYIWFSFTLHNTRHVISTVFSREAAAQMVHEPSVQHRAVWVACLGISSLFCACLRLHVENCSFGYCESLGGLGCASGFRGWRKGEGAGA